ncbi:hypothetical protein MMC09_000958 [Bachmanniomyces sp. S44760]|nr:hypothetical protein [Bachmanniomyces sp. S44760]
MSTQYNSIQAPYNLLRETTLSHIEEENVHDTIAPLIPNARVLDLACGSGFYAYKFLQWGASAVTGVDISSAMIDEARRRGPTSTSRPSSSTSSTTTTTSDQPPTIEFIISDCANPIPTPYSNKPYDIVFGAWLLNYAPDLTNLTSMFRTAALNLKPNGHFIAVTVPPTHDPKAALEAESKARPPSMGGSGGLYCTDMIKDVADGIQFHLHADTSAGNVDFDCFYLRKAVYEDAARGAGFQGGLEWRGMSVSERFLTTTTTTTGENNRPGGARLREVESYTHVPHYALLVVVK